MRKKLTTKEFIEKAKKIHGNKYDYSKVEYLDSRTKVCITCTKHGEFWQTPNSHLQGQGCPVCGKINGAKNKTYTTEEFIERARKIYGNKYDYSKVKYERNDKKVSIICPIHGEFEQMPSQHLNGRGCLKCGIEKNSSLKRLTTEEFIERAKKIHGNKYDYSKVNYTNIFEKVKIICHIKKRNGEEHGEFLQEPHNHLKGNGCPICRNSSLERNVDDFLQSKQIKFIRHADHKIFNWLGKQHLDFYLPEYNIAIECQGEQHFKPYRFEKDDKNFEKRNKLDKLKKILCEKNGIKIIYFSNLNKQNVFLEEKIIKNNNDLINKIYAK
jgi:hypothetical protein